MILIFLSNLLTGMLHITICLLLICRLLPTDRPGRNSIPAGLAGAFFIATLQHLTGFPDSFRIALEAVLIALCASRIQKANTRMSLFISIFYEIAVFFWQFLFMAGMGILFHSQAFLDPGTMEGQAAVWLLHILLAILVTYLWRHLETAGEPSGKIAFRFLSAIAVAGLIAVVMLSGQTILPIPSDTLTAWTIQAVILTMSVQVFHLNRAYQMERELARLKSEQNQLLERDYTTLNQAYAVNAKLFHDFHNHIGVLRQLLSRKKYDEAVQYLDELQAPVREMTDTVWTGDETMDYLINSKAAAAMADGISLQVQVEFPRHTNLRSADLCTILGNLLDNALEAVRQVSAPEQPFIRLTIRRINQMLVIKVENNFQPENSFTTRPLQDNKMPQTTKTGNGLHGWGLKSAQAAAEKYEGMVRTTHAGNIFQAVATLSYHGVNTVRSDKS